MPSHPRNPQTIGFKEAAKIRDIFIPLTESESGGMSMSEAEFSDAYCYTGGSEARMLFDGKDVQLM
jgi:hypothetical protein